MNRYFRFLFLAITIPTLSGCWYLTSRLSTAGVRANRLNGVVNHVDDKMIYGSGQADIAKFGPLAYWGGPIYIPYCYSILGPIDPKQVNFCIGSISNHRSAKVSFTDEVGSKYEWQMSSENYLRGEVGEKVRFYGKAERRWWGYPPQVLLIATVPLDILLFPFELMFSSHSGYGPGP